MKPKRCSTSQCWSQILLIIFGGVIACQKSGKPENQQNQINPSVPQLHNKSQIKSIWSFWGPRGTHIQLLGGPGSNSHIIITWTDKAQSNPQGPLFVNWTYYGSIESYQNNWKSKWWKGCVFISSKYRVTKGFKFHARPQTGAYSCLYPSGPAALLGLIFFKSL